MSNARWVAHIRTVNIRIAIVLNIVFQRCVVACVCWSYTIAHDIADEVAVVAATATSLLLVTMCCCCKSGGLYLSVYLVAFSCDCHLRAQVFVSHTICSSPKRVAMVSSTTDNACYNSWYHNRSSHYSLEACCTSCVR